ncbi:conserved hypothetical protein [Culex quinquefasciatus]|uniref:Uncharacterized protein n=1 Tax=Culex quinquefasciatus TaxID=7176 RepID=B0W831_CULQU|nr:conserved hypothetical protein [Culex quinquefasciatus]|eukprot:XP_001844865.1 conserved hypothetical protein [Culex quinquefasciatus]
MLKLRSDIPRLRSVGVILVQATLANTEDGSNSQSEHEEGANQAEVSDQQSTQSPSVDEQNADKDFENDSMNPDNNSTDTDTATAKPQKETAYDEHVHSNRESKAVIPAVGRTTTKKPSYICTKSNLNYDCILQNVQLNHNEPNIFGLDWKNNLQKNARSQNGICCKDYKRAFNDRLKEMIQEIYVHENVNKKDQEKCKPTKPKIGVNKPNVQTMHNKIAELDSSTREILNELEGVKSQITHIEQEIISNTTRQHKLQAANQNFKQLVEKYSGNYGIPKEGLISPSKTLEKVVKYTQDRKSNSENLLARRTKEVEATNARMESKNSEKFTSQRENEGLEAVLKNIKADESKLKKEKQLLEKTLNRNSPSVHG